MTAEGQMHVSKKVLDPRIRKKRSLSLVGKYGTSGTKILGSHFGIGFITLSAMAQNSSSFIIVVGYILEIIIPGEKISKRFGK